MSQIEVEYIDHMGTEITIVNAARVSFATEIQELTDKDKKLIKYLADHKHLSPFEHTSLTVKISVPLYIRSQIMRHRTFCISGDTNITFEAPCSVRKGKKSKKVINIKKLYNNFKKNPKVYKKMFIRVLNIETNEFETSHISDVYYTGKNPVYRITLNDGKTLTCTENHKILTINGFESLKNAVGLSLSKNNIATMSKDCDVLTNGEYAWKDYNWMKDKRELGLNVSQIAESAGCSYHTIRKWLKIHNLQFNQIESMLNHNKIYGVWNKGKYGYKTNNRVTEDHKNKIRKARSGSNSNFWKGGISSERANIARWTTQIAPKIHKKHNYTCQNCFQIGGELECHHIIPVVINSSLSKNEDNLITLCKKCHTLHHRKTGEFSKYKRKGTTLVPRIKKIIKIEYIGIEDTYDLGVEHSSHNYIANGIIIHNCYNETSRRYTDKDLEFFMPDTLRKQHSNNRQASEGEINILDNAILGAAILMHQNKCLEFYNKLIEKGVCREQARGVLSQDLMTEFYMTGNLRNWAHFIELRKHEGAQAEIQEVASLVSKILIDKFGYAAEVLLNEG